MRLHIACEGLEKGGLTGPGHSAQAQVRVNEHSAHEVGTVICGARPGGSGVWGRSENGGILKGKQGIWEKINLVRYAGVERGRKKDDM